jgi:hypothetical protein
VADAVADATARKEYSVRRYTFVVDYRQNMELPNVKSQMKMESVPVYKAIYASQFLTLSLPLVCP